ncbi:MAG: TonB family protein [Elusimicrobia bacterium]|nr:TonB family protein [Elusimicrobiota bacterium]
MRAASPHFFRNCLAASFALHAGFFGAVKLWIARPFPPLVEVDLTIPMLGTGPAKLGAPKKAAARPLPGPSLPAESAKPQEALKKLVAPKDWVLPGPKTEKIEAAPEPSPTPGGTPEGGGTSPLPGGSGAGADYGVPGGTGNGGAALLRLPQLLNRDEVLANLRRFYPERERRAGREGVVKVILHISQSGRVASVDVLESGGEAFDEAAGQVGRLMRFSPALGPGGAVAVKLGQTMVFRLEE